MSHSTSNTSLPGVAAVDDIGGQRPVLIEVCGPRPGDRRVRVPRKGRQGATRISILLHRVLG